MIHRTLILTATVTPRSEIPELVLRDPASRLADYETSFDFYRVLLGMTFDRLIVVENSGHDLASLRAKACGDPRISFVTVRGDLIPAAHGRACGEYDMIRQTVEAAPEVLEENRQVWKVTGRYLIHNIATIVGRAPDDQDLYCHLRDRPRRWADLYLLGWNDAGFKEFVGTLADRAREDIFRLPPEIIVRAMVDDLRWAGTLRISPRFCQPPAISGRRGSDGTEYLGAKNRRKLQYRRLASKLAPWIWI